MVRELGSIKVKPAVKARLEEEQNRIKKLGGKKVSISEIIEDLLNERDAAAPTERPIDAGLTASQRELLRVVAECFRLNGGSGPLQREAAAFVENAIRLWVRARDRQA